MLGQLSAKDRLFIRTLRDAGVLQDVKDHLLNQEDGVILVTCADGDRFYDIFQHQVRMQAGHRFNPRIHVLGWHGGALACAPCSPVNKRNHADDIFLDQIADACTLKNIRTVALYSHFPCGAASIAGLSIERSLAHQMRAKARIKALNPDLKVACFSHTDYCDGRKRTYFLSKKEWEQWADAHRIQAIA